MATAPSGSPSTAAAAASADDVASPPLQNKRFSSEIKLHYIYFFKYLITKFAYECIITDDVDPCATAAVVNELASENMHNCYSIYVS